MGRNRRLACRLNRRPLARSKRFLPMISPAADLKKAARRQALE
jgi:hypothetical protein